MDFGKVLKS